MIRNIFGKIFPFLGSGEESEPIQTSDHLENLQAADDEIPSHEFLDTPAPDVSSSDIKAHSFLESSEFLDVTGDADISAEIKPHALLTESGEHMLVSPVYSPRSGSSVDPTDRVPLKNVDSKKTTPRKHDGSGDRAVSRAESQSETRLEEADDQLEKEIPSRDSKSEEGLVVGHEGETNKAGKVGTPIIEVTEVMDKKETGTEQKGIAGAVESAEEMTLEKTQDGAKAVESDTSMVGASGSVDDEKGLGAHTQGSYMSYVEQMTANKKLIKAKDLFYQLGFQKGVSKTEIEKTAIQQYKLAASKQAKFWVKDARYYAEILFSGAWIDQNMPSLNGRSGRQKRDKKKKQKNYNINEQFELPGGTCRDFRLKDNPDLETRKENAAAPEGCSNLGQCEKSEDSLEKFVSDYTNSVIDEAIKIAISDGLSESAIMEVIEDVTTSNLANTPQKISGLFTDTPKKGKVTPLDPTRTPRSRPDQLAMGFNYHADVAVKEFPKTLHGEIIPIDLSKQPRERPEQIAIGFNYHSDLIVKESPKATKEDLLMDSSPATPRRRARDQLAMGFSYHSKLLSKDAVLDHNENITKAENTKEENLKKNNDGDEPVNVTPEKISEVKTPKSSRKSVSDTFAVGFSYNSDLILKETLDQANDNLDGKEIEEEGKIVTDEQIVENEDLNGNIAELADLAGELKLAGSLW